MDWCANLCPALASWHRRLTIHVTPGHTFEYLYSHGYEGPGVRKAHIIIYLYRDVSDDVEKEYLKFRVRDDPCDDLLTVRAAPRRRRLPDHRA